MTEPFPCLASLLRAGALFALLAFPGLALAEDNPHDTATAPPQQTAEPHAVGQPAAPPQATPPQAVDLLPPTATTHHSIRVADKTLNYTAEAGSIPLPGAAGGKPTAEIFYVAYAREPLDAKRPITFVFNGGPGAAAAYLHLGGIGPRAVEVDDKGEFRGPPPRLLDNPNTWLDMTDLVFVDPVGTGYSRVTDPKDEEKFWGVEQDTDALVRLRPALSHPGRADGLARVPGGRELWRVPRRGADSQAAEDGGHLALRHGAHLARARLRASQWRGL